MIQVTNLSYGVPLKELFENISFLLEEGRHYALIGSNGTGKSTLAGMLMHPENYLYDGKILREEGCRMGYASQFSLRNKTRECTVFAFLMERFAENQQAIEDVCQQMALAQDPEPLFTRYQELLDIHDAMDADNSESNIRRKLAQAGMSHLEETPLSKVSGGEYKLLQIMKEMLLAPDLLILDEPDVFLDFGNLHSLSGIINGYPGILLVITHNRYLLNHCFDGILHLEAGALYQFDGTYPAYRSWQFRRKLELIRQSQEEQEEIQRTERMVEILRKRATDMVNPVIGRSVNAKQTQLDRLLARQIDAPFIEMRAPRITLSKAPFPSRTEDTEPDSREAGAAAPEKEVLLKVTDHTVAFEKTLLQDISFTLHRGEKAALAGRNGTGKTSLLKDILKHSQSTIQLAPGVKYASLSQLQGRAEDADKTVRTLLQDHGLYTEEEIRELLSDYCLSDLDLRQKAADLSGGEQNLLQIALLSLTDAELLILDEPTSHLDIWAQNAMEKALAAFPGTVLMVSHDFYLVANCADYVLFAEDGTLRRMRTRNFRRMVYEKYFHPSYLEADRRLMELEAAINEAFLAGNLTAAEKLCDQLESIPASCY